jgi:acyl-CoA synthetase (AMP-forming)/AMP-acid ligase II
MPHEIVVAPLASLPRTSSGKPQRRKAREMYLDGTLARARSVHDNQPLASGIDGGL